MVYFLEIDSLAPRVHPRIIVICSIRYGMQHNTIKFDENHTITDKVYNSKLSPLCKFIGSQVSISHTNEQSDTLNRCSIRTTYKFNSCALKSS